MGMFVVAPATTSFHHHDPSPICGNAADPSHPVNVGVIPLLPAAAGDGAIPFWQSQQIQQSGYFNKTGTLSFDQGTAAGNPQNSGGGGGVMTCQDCGNQAKKDCGHRRCRTCCRSRGFDCSTHVKSTWVPASRRRERQMTALSGGGGAGAGASSGSTSGTKKPRLISSTATTSRTSNSNTPPRSYDTSSSHQDAGLKEALPGQVRAPAVFKCVRVTAVDSGGDDEYAYQAVVRIGGRFFKGFLYDQGAESGEGFPNLSELHLGGGRNGGSSSSPLLDTSEVYGRAGGGILGGGGYGDTIS